MWFASEDAWLFTNVTSVKSKAQEGGRIQSLRVLRMLEDLGGNNDDGAGL